MRDLTRGQVFLYALAILGLVAIVTGVGACARDLTLDSRERKQDKIERCLDSGYGGAIEIEGRGFICTGGGTDRD